MIALSVMFAVAGASAIAAAAVRGRTARPIPWTMPYVAPLPERPVTRIVLVNREWQHGPDRCVLHVIG